MKTEDIIRQLQGALPNFTDKFTDNFSVSSLTRSGTTVTAITTAPHLLSTGGYAFIFGAKNPVVISTLTQAGGIASAETATDHNLVFSQAEKKLNQETYVDIDGATETKYNGTHELLSSVNRRNFTYSIDATAASPAGGSPELLQDNGGYNGWHQVTVVDPTTFTYEITETPNSPAAGTIEARVYPRITGAVSSEKVIAAYTKKPPDELFAFVVVNDKVANKSREVMSDATTTPGRGAEYRQLVIQPFTVFVIFPTTQSIAGRQERDAADDLVRPFMRSLLRVKFPTGFTEDPFSGCTFSTDGFFEYNEAIYVHAYQFETTAWITYGDTTAPEIPAAFRTINLNFKSTLSDTAGTIMTAKIDLDEDQLT